MNKDWPVAAAMLVVALVLESIWTLWSDTFASPRPALSDRPPEIGAAAMYDKEAASLNNGLSMQSHYPPELEIRVSPDGDNSQYLQVVVTAWSELNPLVDFDAITYAIPKTAEPKPNVQQCEMLIRGHARLVGSGTTTAKVIKTGSDGNFKYILCNYTRPGFSLDPEMLPNDVGRSVQFDIPKQTAAQSQSLAYEDGAGLDFLIKYADTLPASKSRENVVNYAWLSVPKSDVRIRFADMPSAIVSTTPTSQNVDGDTVDFVLRKSDLYYDARIVTVRWSEHHPWIGLLGIWWPLAVGSVIGSGAMVLAGRSAAHRLLATAIGATITIGPIVIAILTHAFWWRVILDISLVVIAILAMVVLVRLHRASQE